jgi:hypothetical protein
VTSPRRSASPQRGGSSINDSYGALEDQEDPGRSAAILSLVPFVDATQLPGPKAWLWEGLRFVAIRVVVVGLSSLIAIVLPEFELVVALVGSLGASFLAFIIPGLLALKVLPQASSAVAYIFLIVFGVMGGGFGAGIAIKDIVRKTSQC